MLMTGLMTIDNTLHMTNLSDVQIIKAHGLTNFGKAGTIQWNGQLNYISAVYGLRFGGSRWLHSVVQAAQSCL